MQPYNIKRCKRPYLNENNIVRGFLLENYSSKHFSRQISAIARDFMMFKEYVDRRRIQEDVVKGYLVSVSLRPFFGNDKNVHEWYLRNHNFRIAIIYTQQESNGFANGAYRQGSLHSEGPQIEVYAARNSTYDSIYNTLMHEMTHLIDEMIEECKRNKSHKYPVMGMLEFGIPSYAAIILYNLWTNTEFNAFQASGDDRFGELMNCLEAANNSNDLREWMLIQSCVAAVTKNDKFRTMRTWQFKRYFIKTSFKLLKKFIKKAY